MILVSHVWKNHSSFNSGLLLASIKNKLKERFISFWNQRMLGDETKKKLRTYRLLKHNFGIEPYLEDIHDKSVRKCLSSFRISTHRLRIDGVDMLVKSQRIDYVYHVIKLRMRYTFFVNVKSMKIKGKYYMISSLTSKSFQEWIQTKLFLA